MRFDEKKVAAAIEAALRQLDYDDEPAWDAAFHMTDWLDDLSAYAEFCESPDDRDPEYVQDLLMSFLVHVPSHITAAHKVVMEAPVTDVFGIGAVSGGKRVAAIAGAFAGAVSVLLGLIAARLFSPGPRRSGRRWPQRPDRSPST